MSINTHKCTVAILEALNTIDGKYSGGSGIFLAFDLESSQSDGISGAVFIWGEFIAHLLLVASTLLGTPGVPSGKHVVHIEKDRKVHKP